MLAGFVVVQIGLGVAVDQWWPALRDPEFANLSAGLEELQKDSPGRPLVLALGSSRTEMGLRANLLSQPAGGARPLVFNFAIPASGPMFQQIVLRRLLAEGQRPAFLFLEVMPTALSRSEGARYQEEHQLDPARLSTAELARLVPSLSRPDLILARWGCARLLPVYRHQAELRDAIGLDVPVVDARRATERLGRDPFGWLAYPGEITPELNAARTCDTLSQYAGFLHDDTLASQPFHDLRELLALCKCQGISSALVIPPESTAFRAAYQSQHLLDFIAQAAAEFAIPLHDARTWVDDSGFWDGHHLWLKGAEQYTLEFDRQVFRPLLNRTAAN
jgi:hypothetical protein